MSDLISRSALIEEVCTYKETGCGSCKFQTCCPDIINIINGLPTVEAKPVVSGEWIKIKDWDENDNALFECTNCHYGDTHAKAMKVPYCWHCGAKMTYADMRGGKND